jgi:hypothetical protein
LGEGAKQSKTLILELKWGSFLSERMDLDSNGDPGDDGKEEPFFILPIQNTTLLQSHHEHHLVTLSLFSQISMVLVVRPIQHQRRDDDQALARINVAAAYTL